MATLLERGARGAKAIRLVWVFVAAFGLGLGLAAPGCGDDCTDGTESCSCTGGGACDPGLSCLSNRCVKASGPQGGRGGTGGSAGGAGGRGGTGGGAAVAGSGGAR